MPPNDTKPSNPHGKIRCQRHDHAWFFRVKPPGISESSGTLILDRTEEVLQTKKGDVELETTPMDPALSADCFSNCQSLKVAGVGPYTYTSEAGDWRPVNECVKYTRGLAAYLYEAYICTD